MWRICLVFLYLILEVTSQGFYKVIGPRVIRPNSEYHVALSTQATSVPTSVTVALLGRSLTGKTFAEEETITIQPYSTRIVRLEIGDIEPGDYQMTVRGSGGVVFETTRSLKYIKKSYSVFIQTDKSIYKPGHKILFRAIVLNFQLKPAAEVRNELLNIHISDGQGNKVKQWRSVTATRGVFSEELQLSDNPVLGKWNISVTVHKQTFNKTIEVASYILPKFLINIQAPKHITFKENILTANIQSLYSYGKKVKGDATVTVYPTIYSGVIQPIFQNPIRKVFPIEGSATVNFDIEKELKLSDEYERTVIIDVRVEEALTGRRQNNSYEVHLHKYEYKIEIIKTADYYKPGMKYVVYVKVTNHDGTPIRNDKNTIKIRHGYSRVDEIYMENTHKIDKNGLVKLELYPPRNSSNETALRIEAEYYDLKERMSPVPAAVSPSNTFLQATVETEKLLINLDIEISINCTEPMKYINYELLGRGDVVIANTFKVDNKKEFKFHFTATHAMVPVAHLIVSYVRDDGELVADSVDIEIDGLLQNFIDIQVNTIETEPEADIDLIIRAQPNSYVGLLAVDQNVGMLRSGHDVTPSQVSNELRMYDFSKSSPYWAVMKDTKFHFAWKPGSSNARDVFYDSGALLLTNSIVTSHRPTLEDIYLRPVSYDTSTIKSDRGVGLSFHTVTRPPLAGPYAFSRIPRPVWDKPKVYLTQDIADTWLFTNFSSGFEGKTSIRRKIPKTLNTWVISGFSLDPLHGLGLITTPKKLKVTKPFIVTLDLPYSVKRGEILSVPIVVYNHMEQNIVAEVTLHNQEQLFDFVDVSSFGNNSKKVELYRRQKISIKRNSGASLAFMITPRKLGNIELKITASSQSKTDSVTKELRVIPEGETQYYTKTLLIDLRNTASYKGNITFEIPKNVVQGSESIEASVVGDFLGPTIINLENLIRKPTGSGEQNLVHFVPNLLVLDYLINTDQLTQPIQKQAVEHLEISYQEQLSYKRPDGSFSAFGKTDEKGSVWITAYTAMSLSQAVTYIYVDETIILNALKWLSEIQAANGSFVERDAVIHQELQSREGNSLALTAFTVLCFLENQRTTSIYTNTINKGLDYIARNIDENESLYTIAICSYVLQIAKHTSKQNAFNLLDSKAKTGNNLKWWAKDVPKNEMKNPWNYLPKSIDIETTSYALLAFLEANLLDDALPVANWILGEENNLGGFTSSQDTVLGLAAIHRLVKQLSAVTNAQIEFTTRKQEVNRFSVNKNTAMIVQKLQIGKDVRQVNVTATGSGFVLFRIAYKYNMNVTGPWPMFTLDPQVDKNSNRDHLQLSVCTAFVSRNLTETAESNMAVMEVNFPSGFTADTDSLPSLEVSQNVQRVETKNEDTTVMLYFNNISMIEYCPTVSAFRTHKVADLRPVYVTIYDYYDSSRHARVFYKGRKATRCNICEGDNCGDECISEPDLQVAAESTENKGGCATFKTNLFTMLFLCSIILYNNK